MNAKKGQGNRKPPWHLETRHLNFFWLLIYPRIIARTWRSDIPPDEFHKCNYGKFICNELETFRVSVGRYQKETRRLLEQLIKSFRNMQIDLIPGFDFDFVLHEKGIALPLVEEPKSSADLFRNYRDRPVSLPLVNLPNMRDEVRGLQLNISIKEGSEYSCRASFDKAGDKVEQANGAEGAGMNDFMINWLGKVEWLLRGSLYTSLIRALDRVIADAWYEETLRKKMVNGSCPETEIWPAERFTQGGARKILSEYLEESLEGPFLENFNIEVDRLENGKEGSAFLTSKGLTVRLTSAPDIDEIMIDMAAGRAGNPMYTNTVDTSGTL